MKSMTVHSRNQVTEKVDAIEVTDVRVRPWGWSGFVKSEIDAYKVAYEYRTNPYGFIVEYSHSEQQFLVTMLNAAAAGMGITQTMD